MALDAFETVELHMLERRRMVGSDGRDWLRVTLGVALTSITALGTVYLTNSAMPAVVVSLLGITLTVHSTVVAGRKVITSRIAYLRARALQD